MSEFWIIDSVAPWLRVRKSYNLTFRKQQKFMPNIIFISCFAKKYKPRVPKLPPNPNTLTPQLWPEHDIWRDSWWQHRLLAHWSSLLEKNHLPTAGMVVTVSGRNFCHYPGRLRLRMRKQYTHSCVGPNWEHKNKKLTWLGGLIVLTTFIRSEMFLLFDPEQTFQDYFLRVAFRCIHDQLRFSQNSPAVPPKTNFWQWESSGSVILAQRGSVFENHTILVSVNNKSWHKQSVPLSRFAWETLKQMFPKRKGTA